MGDMERELDRLLSQLMSTDSDAMDDALIKRIVALEAQVARQRRDRGLRGSYTANYLDR